MDTDIASKLAANGITTRDALADLAGDELVELTGMDAAKAQDLIMKARAHWFEPRPKRRRPARRRNDAAREQGATNRAVQESAWRKRRSNNSRPS